MALEGHLKAMLLVGAFAAAPAAVAAQEPSNTARQRQTAFEAMMADPTDPERAFEFAQAAVAAGDLRGAIAALERILQINPELANIQLELGVLYLRVGQTDLATLYLRRALQAPDISEPVRDRARALLARAERGRQRHFFSGSIYAGGRYDTNANAGPASRVRVLGLDALLSESARGREDYSAELAANATYIYPLETQAGHEIEANFLTYNRRYDRSSEINLNSAGVDVGPRLYVGGPTASALSVRPFVSGSYLLLDDESYLRQLGGGLNLRRFFTGASYIDVTFEASDQRFFNSTLRPTTSTRSGSFFELRGALSYDWRPGTRFFAGAGIGGRDARENFESFDEGALRIGVTHVYPSPFGLESYPWSSTLSAGVRRTVYDEPDPIIDPAVNRKDTRLDVVLTNNVRLARELTLVVSLQYTDNRSSLPNFEYHNTSVSLGLVWNF
jgi:tetratricopeptide (TPR) repeat protein